MNKVVLIGRLTRDPELRYTGNNTPVATFSLAVNRPFSNQQGEREADFINIVVWRKQAENVKNYLTQGSQCAVEGRIQTRNYDANDGSRKYITEIIADNVTFLGNKPAGSGSNVEAENSFVGEEDIATTDITEDPFKDFGEEVALSDDDLPF